VPSLLGSSDRLEEKLGQLTSTRGGEWWFAEEVKQRRVMCDKKVEVQVQLRAGGGRRYKVRLNLGRTGLGFVARVENAAAHLASQDLADSHQGQGAGAGKRGRKT